MDDKLWYLKQANLFEQLSAEEIARVESRSRMQVFPRKGIVYLPNDPGNSVYLLTAGRIRLYHVTSEGKETVLAFIEPGEIFGELSLFGQAQREEFAEAMEKSTIVRIPGDEMQQLLADRPAIMMQVTRMMGLRRQRIERRLKALLFRSNRDRLVYLLLELAEKYGQPFPEGIKLGIRLSHQDMASMIGSTRETVTVLLGELQYARSLIVKRRQIILTDLKQLASVLDEVTPEVEQLIQSSSQRAQQSTTHTQQPFATRRIPE